MGFDTLSARFTQTGNGASLFSAERASMPEFDYTGGL
jgi:hypothetical protein